MPILDTLSGHVAAFAVFVKTVLKRHLAVIVMVMVVLIAVSIVLVRAIAPYSIHLSTTRYLLTVFLWVAMLVMLWLYTHNNVANLPGHVQLPGQQVKSEGISDFLEKNTHVICIYVFGAGSICLRLFYLVTSLQCIVYYTSYLDWNNITTNMQGQISYSPGEMSSLPPLDLIKTEEISRLVLHVSSLLFFTFQLPFLHRFCKSHHLQKHFFSHISIAIIIGADIAMWLYTFLRETNIMPNYFNDRNEPSVEVLTSLPKACVEHATVMNMFMQDTVQPMLFPLTLEFMLASCEILIHVWRLNFIEGSTPRTRKKRKRRKRRGHRWKRLKSRKVISKCEKALVWFLSLFDITLALSLIIIEGVVVKFCLLHEGISSEHDEFMVLHSYDMSIKLPTTVVRIMCICIPGLFIVSVCCGVLACFMKRKNAEGSNGSDWVMRLAAAGVIGLTLTEIVFCGIYIKQIGMNDDGWIYLLNAVESFLYMPQIILTATVIYLGQTRVFYVSHRLSSTLQSFLNFLTVYSFGRWVIDSFLETEYLVSRDEFSHTWANCVQFFLPFCIYFRFVSVFFLLKVKRLLRQFKARKIRSPLRSRERNLLPPGEDDTYTLVPNCLF